MGSLCIWPADGDALLSIKAINKASWENTSTCGPTLFKTSKHGKTPFKNTGCYSVEKIFATSTTRLHRYPNTALKGGYTEESLYSLLMRSRLGTFSLKSWLAEMYKSLKQPVPVHPRTPLLKTDCEATVSVVSKTLVCGGCPTTLFTQLKDFRC